jgi:hypothetical protein
VTGDLRAVPWTVTGSCLAYAAPGLNLVAEQVIHHADGRPGVHHRLLEPDTVRVVAIDTDGDLALVWRWHPAIGTPSLELPSGTINPAEDDPAGDRPAQAARRALRTDCGLAADTWTSLGVITARTGAAAQTVHLYQAHDPRRVPRPPTDGHAHPLALPYTIITAGAADGPVTDAASLTALLTAEHHRHRGTWQLPTTCPPTLATARLRPNRRSRRRRLPTSDSDVS